MPLANQPLPDLMKSPPGEARRFRCRTPSEINKVHHISGCQHFLGSGIRNLDSECLLECHHQLDTIKAHNCTMGIGGFSPESLQPLERGQAILLLDLLFDGADLRGVEVDGFWVFVEFDLVEAVCWFLQRGGNVVEAL